ncbi:MAG: DUF3034 family protein [Burkholderiales bacterium]|nr:DUF3034 family protein [Burkholderiales bacterium]
MPPKPIAHARGADAPCPTFCPTRLLRAACCGLVIAAAGAGASAAGGKLLLTGGVSSIDGAAGGGLTPWAVTGSYATEGEWGATAHATAVRTGDYRLATFGVLASYDDRFELSLAHQAFDTGEAGIALGLPGLRLKQDIAGAKLRLFGDAIVDSDTWIPQVALGVLGKRADAGGLAPTLASLGARLDGVDVYLSATKLFLAQGVLANLTLRATRANQNGLLGFGGTGESRTRLLPEVSLAWLLRRDLAIGAEWRAKPDNLNPSALGAGLKEGDWADLFVAWAPGKQLSLTLAYVDLGAIVPAVKARRQRGGYLSAQLAF